MADEESITDIMGTAEARQKLKDMFPGKYVSFEGHWNCHRGVDEKVEYFAYVSLIILGEGFIGRGNTPAAAIKDLQKRLTNE